MSSERDQPPSVERPPRGRLLSTIAVLLGILAISNLTMVFQHMVFPKMGAMLFGARFHSIVTNAIFGTLLGSLLAAYAYGIWKMKAWVVRIAIGYALYMPVCLMLFWFLHPEIAWDRVYFFPAYHALLLVGFVGAGIHVAYHRDLFR